MSVTIDDIARCAGNWSIEVTPAGATKIDSFAAVLNGSVYGDQCSPISDTTILSSMTTGCDLMDHVKSQIVPASYAAALAGILWTICAWWTA